MRDVRARIVHQNIDTPEFSRCGSNHFLDLIGSSNMACDRFHGGPKFAAT
jgi:hypothetical protein